ncbi:MAG: DNA polymerase III subunit gamma/tau [Sedimentisphaerales bacterium]
MSYTVLARKYRSQTFDDVVGQDPIAQTLKNAIKTGRVAHAYLFTGTRGVGKTTMARILAKALNCLAVDEPTTEPCCKCDSCVAVNVGEDIDVIEIDGASNNRVDEIRELRENAIYRPARSRFKIYIIDEVHMLTVSAFNALLKTLEEPPSHIKFIFATTEPNKVIATIQSRCQRFDFSNIGPAVIAEQLKSVLKQEKIKYEEDLILPLAKMANGSMRDGLSLLDRLISAGVEPLSTSLLEEFLGCPNSEKIWNLVEQIGNSDAAGTLAAIEDLISSGVVEVQIVDSLIDSMRDLMVVKSTGRDSRFQLRPTSGGTRTVDREPQTPANEFQGSAELNDIESVRDNWPDILKLIGSELGPGTAALLSSAVPNRFEDGVLTLEFSPSAHTRIGASKDRLEQVQTLLRRQFSAPLTLKFKTARHDEAETESGPSQPKTFSQRRNDLLNDPAVKTVLMGLDATITGIEEDAGD